MIFYLPNPQNALHVMELQILKKYLAKLLSNDILRSNFFNLHSEEVSVGAQPLPHSENKMVFAEDSEKSKKFSYQLPFHITWFLNLKITNVTMLCNNGS